MFNKFICFMLSLFVLFSLSSCKASELKKVKIAEVAHSVFYAPQYVAIELGYFKEEGLEIELFNANGADKVTASLISNDVLIGLQGPEPTIYLYNNDQDNYLVNFAQLTKCDGAFIFGREDIKDFSLQHLKGKSILGGRAGGVPLMSLEYGIKKAGLSISHDGYDKDVYVRTDVAFGAMAGSFLNGEGDFTTLFEPVASEMVKNKEIYLLDSVAKYSGEICFTSYCTSKLNLTKNKDLLIKFTKALYKGQQFVLNNTDEEVARHLVKAFPDETLSVLTEVVKRYRSIDAWCKDPMFIKNSFDNLQEVMITAGELVKKVPFDVLVTYDIAKEVVK